MTGIGLTVISAVTGLPEQVWLFVTKDGVTLIRPWAGVEPVFVVLKAPIELPEPEDNRPMLELEFVQAYCVPVKFEEKLITVLGLPEQTV